MLLPRSALALVIATSLVGCASPNATDVEVRSLNHAPEDVHLDLQARGVDGTLAAWELVVPAGESVTAVRTVRGDVREVVISAHLPGPGGPTEHAYDVADCPAPVVIFTIEPNGDTRGSVGCRD